MSREQTPETNFEIIVDSLIHMMELRGYNLLELRKIVEAGALDGWPDIKELMENRLRKWTPGGDPDDRPDVFSERYFLLRLHYLSTIWGYPRDELEPILAILARHYDKPYKMLADLVFNKGADSEILNINA